MYVSGNLNLQTMLASVNFQENVILCAGVCWCKRVLQCTDDKNSNYASCHPDCFQIFSGKQVGAYNILAEITKQITLICLESRGFKTKADCIKYAWNVHSWLVYQSK